MASRILVVILIFGIQNCFCSNEEYNLISTIEERLESKVNEYANYLAKWLEGFNDQHLGNSELGRLLHYSKIKPKLEETGEKGRSMKKMSMALMPLIFHVGATSTWMVLTTIMAAKSVAIGLLLLVFKIAVSSAKVASFFTALKGKDHHHHGWTTHGHERGFSSIGSSHDLWHSYNPEWTPSDASPHDYKTLPTFKDEHSEIYDVDKKYTQH